MRKYFILLILAISICSHISAQEIDIYLIGGQSNATGQGYVRNIPSTYVIDTSVMFYYSPYLNSGKGANVWGPLRQASESLDKFGPELSMGTSLHKLFPDRKIGLIKHGLAGSNLYEEWNPGNRVNEKQGAEYKKFITTVKRAIKELKEQGYTPIIRGMVWQQGEGDAREIAGMNNSRRYGINLKNFIEQVRIELDCENMIFVYGTVMPMEATRFTGRALVKKAQHDVAEAAHTELSVKNAILVEADDLEMRRHDYKTPMPTDDVHLGTYGLLNLGERFAKALYEQLKAL